MNAPTLDEAQEVYARAVTALRVGTGVLGSATQPGTRLSEDDLAGLGDLIRKADILLALAEARGEATLSPATQLLLPEIRLNRRLAALLLAT